MGFFGGPGKNKGKLTPDSSYSVVASACPPCQATAAHSGAPGAMALPVQAAAVVTGCDRTARLSSGSASDLGAAVAAGTCGGDAQAAGATHVGAASDTGGATAPQHPTPRHQPPPPPVVKQEEEAAYQAVFAAAMQTSIEEERRKAEADYQPQLAEALALSAASSMKKTKKNPPKI